MHFHIVKPLSSNSRYKSKNDADEAVSVVSLTSSSGGYINGRNSANLELLIDKTSPIYQKCQIYFFIHVWRKSVFDIYFTELGAALTTVLPVLFTYCYKYRYSDSRIYFDKILVSEYKLFKRSNKANLFIALVQ
jgi:hypothetical protein